MNVFKWTNPKFFMCFSPDEGGAPASSSGDAAGSSVPASSDDAAGSTLSPEPASSTPSSEVASPWDGFNNSYEEDEIAVPVAPVAPVEPASVSVAPMPLAPVVEPQANPQAPVAPVPQTPQEPTSSPQAASPPQLSPSDPVGVATALEQNRDAVIEHLAQTRFALTEADIAELESNAAAAVPKLLARAMYETQTTMYKFLAQAVPGMIQRHQTVSKANSDAETKFFDAHKVLGLKMDDAKHREVAMRMASVYRQTNPGLTLEQLIADVGPMVAMALKLSPIPNQPTPSRPNMPGFRPAVGGGGASPAPAEANEWMGLGGQFDED